MAIIKAYKGMRFNCDKAGCIEELVCPPYDIISEEQREGYIKTNPHNIIRLELPTGEDRYNKANDILNNWLEEGVLIKEDKPAIYIYEEEFTAYSERKSIKGIICRVKIEEFSKGVILPHEFTLSKAKEDRLNLMKATNCNFSQIYSLYMDNGKNTIDKIDSLSNGEPNIQLTDGEGVVHRMWIITDEKEIEDICNDFVDRKLYIADGHHRYETALNYRNYLRENGKAKEGDACDYQMMMLVDMEHPGLVVFPTHRLVRDLTDFNAEKALESCKKYFDVTEYDDISTIENSLMKLYEEGKKAYAFYSGNNKYSLLVLKDEKIIEELLPDASKATQQLDVTVLHTLILEKIFGIDAENMAKQINLTYTKIFGEAISSVDSGKAQCAFILNPTRVSEIRDVASNGEKMPQKSTYFYPKMITGLVMNQLED
ncbi:MAG: DUF1015 domain-containing protein [Acutalibacteraceae bacterium]|nr:DUF1015 domain-containing protein [Acutalibacteraceae bacterium]